MTTTFEKGPEVRLAVVSTRMNRKYTRGPDVRLATFDVPAVHQTLSRPQVTKPALLVSYVYLDPFLSKRDTYEFRDWVLDSGAFSAFYSGTVIDLDAYIAKCQELKATDPKLAGVFALDVIGDHRASLRNVEKMWDEGVEAIPCYHEGEPLDVLLHLARTYPKIALGGVARKRAKFKLAWAQWCFGHIWPARVHGFGFGAESHILALPWHSVDATNWELGACRFGRWAAFGNMSVRGSEQNLQPEIDHFLRIEALARVKWGAQMELLETKSPARAENPAGSL